MSEKSCRAKEETGFTLVEMLVVLGILGLLMAAFTASYAHLKKTALQSHAQRTVSELSTALSVYITQNRKWPTAWRDKEEVDAELCWYLQESKLFDVTTYKRNSGGGLMARDESNINRQSIDRFGLLDPWGQAALKRVLTKDGDAPQVSKIMVDSSGKSANFHRLQIRLDRSYNGMVEEKEGAPYGIPVRAPAIVWSRGPDGTDDEELVSQERYPKDDRLSWPHGLTRAEKKESGS